MNAADRSSSPHPLLACLRRIARAGGGRGPKPGRVAILRLYGPIGGGGRSAEWIETARRLSRQRGVPAVVLDIDSPGGSASASDYLYLAIKRLAERKPVVAHVRGVGASGSYLAAMASQRLIVAPSSVIGSIGVISAGPRLPRLLDRLGVSVEEHRAGRLKGMGAPWRQDTAEESEREQQLVDAFYDRFVERVAEGRHLARQRVVELATGEVWLGSQAVELGLADSVGDMDDAIAAAASLAGVPAEAAPVRIRRPILFRLADRFATRLAASVADELEARLLGDRYLR
jgi:protease-4